MQSVQSESGEMPLELDETSSPTTVYVREQIEPFVREDAMSGDVVGFRYLEKQYSRQEWQELQIAAYVLDLEFRLVLLETQGGII